MSPEEMHFRLAESQFLRMCPGTNLAVSQVEVIINPALMLRYEAFKQSLIAAGQPVEVLFMSYSVFFVFVFVLVFEIIDETKTQSLSLRF
jgi:hypothetical protein